MKIAEALDEINCGLARDRGEEDEIKMVSRRTETVYKAEEMDEVAQQAEVRGWISTVNAAIVPWKSVFLSGETCVICVPETESGGGSNIVVTCAGVSRRRSSSALGQRAERKERGCSHMNRRSL